jgi:hypothetical protein
MAIQVQWANPEQTAIHLKMERGWTWDDLYGAIQRSDDLLTSVPHRVDLIIDISAAGGIPRDFMRVAGDVFASGEARSNEGKKIVVGAGWLIKGAYNTFLKVYGGQLKNRPFLFAATMDEANAMRNGA